MAKKPIAPIEKQSEPIIESEPIVEPIRENPIQMLPPAPKPTIRWLRVLHNYGGKMTGERRIEPGIYVWGDECLFGVEAYLIANGHAIEVEREE